MAYVRQDAAFFSNLTARETVRLVGALRGLTGTALEEAVEGTLKKMGLSSCADTLVGGDTGGPATRGISGGERKRLSIACELVSRAAEAGASGGAFGGGVLLVDEPTTGLDAFQADRVVGKLAELARRERAAVVATLHQPRSASFAKCDDVILMTGQGRVAFAGATKDAVAHFAAAGYPCPEQHNAAEHLIDLVSVDETDPAQAEKDLRRITELERVWERKMAAGDDGVRRRPSRVVLGGGGRETVRRVGPLRQFGLLLGRAFRQSRRDAFVNLTRAAASVGLGTIFGLVFGKLPFKGEKAVTKRTALVMQLAINASFISMTKSLNAFPRERKVVQAEAKAGLYRPSPYFLSKLLVEAPLDAALSALFGVVSGPLNGLRPEGRAATLASLGLMSAGASALGLLVGAAAPSVEVALALGPCAMVLSILLGDVVGAFSEVPPAMQKIAKLSVVRWGLMGMLVAEFSGLTLDMTPEGGSKGAAGPPPGWKGPMPPPGWTGPPPPSARLQMPWARSGTATAQLAPPTAQSRVLVRGEDVLASFGGDWADPPNAFARACAAQARLGGAFLLATLALLALQGGGGHCVMDEKLRCDENLDA